ncbi:HTH-type transcriptional regulator GltC [Allocatenococcus thiocycli]|jgi:DNA-binding transcriptional LysR family regulator|nr:HTH-type transcriptional regulator GltC [Catenococcus thiocycli]
MRSRDLQIDWLKSFVATVDAGSISGATRLVHRSQSAVSLQIQKLEAAIGSPVLLRDSRGILLTSTGNELLVYARKILRLHSEALEVTRGDEIRGQIRIGVPEDYAQAYLSPVIRAFSLHYPNVEVLLTCEPSALLIEQIESGRLDLAVTTVQGLDKGIYLFNEAVHWVASEAYGTWNKDPMPIAAHDEGSHIRNVVLDMLDKCGRRYKIVYQSPSTAGQIVAATSGIAVAVLTECSLTPELKVLGEKEGLPMLPSMKVEIIRRKGSENIASIDAMYNEIIGALQAELHH